MHRHRELMTILPHHVMGAANVLELPTVALEKLDQAFAGQRRAKYNL
jgi:hypothetical protein